MIKLIVLMRQVVILWKQGVSSVEYRVLSVYLCVFFFFHQITIISLFANLIANAGEIILHANLWASQSLNFFQKNVL